MLITAPSASSSTAPLDIVFTIDASQIRAGESEASVQVFRDGSLVSPCLGGPTEAVPEPCVRSRTLLIGGDVQLRILATHTSPWAFGYPLCGNGGLDGGETCDPPAGGCGGGDSCKADCTCGPVCNCCAGSPSTVTLTHGLPGGTCGTVINSMGVAAMSLACNTIYFGGGGNSVPAFPIPDSQFVLDVQSCSPVEETLILGPTTVGQTGNIGTCTSAGCRFGAPMAVPNAGSTPTSACVVPHISQDVSGVASCGGVVTQLVLPLRAEIFLTGDTATDPSQTIPGIQSCPLCSGGACIGGANNGMACVAGSSAFNPGYPTSNDCPPDPMYSIGTIPVGPELTTGAVSWTATLATHDTGSTASVQTRVFVGYCRDADITGLFEDPAHQCWENGMAVGNACSGTFESCEQRTNGAFGPAGGANNTINQVGAVAGCLADELPHSVGLVGPMRIPPSFNPTIDAAADLPGPGTFGLTGTMQVQ